MNIELNCPVCGAAYQANTNRLKHGRQTTCSVKCSYLLRAKKQKDSIELVCAVCGKNFTRAKSHIKGKHGSNFCSAACHYKGMTLGKSKRVVRKPYNISEAGRAAWKEGAKKAHKTRIEKNNYKHADSTKATLRNATCKAIAEGRIRTSSQIEEKVAAVLNSLEICFLRQHPIRNAKGQYCCVFDFFIPSRMTVVEVNGTFWHSDKRLYPEGPVHAIQKRNADKWNNKLTIINNLGYSLIELWEKDIEELGNQYIIERLSAIS